MIRRQRACRPAQAFNLLSVLIERLADGVAPYADGLLALLSQVWRSGEGQSLLRAQARARHLSIAEWLTGTVLSLP